MIRNTVWTIAAAAALGAGGAQAGSITGGFTSMVVFGDSLSDTGRVKQMTENLSGGLISYPPAPYNDGRFTGGQNYVDVLQDMYGLTSDVDLFNYAFGGAKAVTQVDLIADFGEQVREFSQDGAPGTNTLAVVNFGPNDAFHAAEVSGEIAGDGSDLASVIQARQAARQAGRQAANAIYRNIVNLSSMNVTDVLLFNLVDVGATPRFMDPSPLGVNSFGLSNGTYATLTTDAFNTRLARNADRLRDLGLDIFEVDLNSAFDDFLSNPADYGLSDSTSACGTYSYTDAFGLNYYDFSDATCDETDIDGITAPFWDDVHPGQILHEQIAYLADDTLLATLPAVSPMMASEVMSGPTTVPLPGSVLLLGGGLVALGAMRRAAQG